MMQENIASLLQSTDESDRRSAVAIIARTPSKESLLALVRIAEYDVSADVRYFARRAINSVKASLQPYPSEAVLPAPVANEEIAAFFAGEIREAETRINIVKQIISSGSRLGKLDITGGLLEGLIRIIEMETDPTVISALLIAVGKFGSEREIKLVAGYLSHENSRVRANAVEALELIGSMKAYPHIVAKLSDEDNRVRGNVVAALKNLGAIDTMRIIRLMAESGRPAMMATAAFSLKLFPRDENIETLLKLHNSGDANVRKNAVSALRFYHEKGIKRAGEILSKLGVAVSEKSGEAEVLVKEDEASRKFRIELKSKIGDNDPKVRIGVIKQAMEKGILGVGPVFLERLRSGSEKDEKVVATLVHALGKLEFKDALNTLILRLKEQDNRVRANAIEAIGLLIGREGMREAVIHLVPFLKDPNNRARANAIIALAREKNVGIYATLLGMIRSGDMNMQRSAIYAIMELKDAAYYEFLAELENSLKAAEEVRQKAKLMIARLAEEGIVVKAPDLGERGSRTFRIFVSSTFSDTKPERDYLQKKIFPELRNLCESHGYRFQAVDLRWGVTSESAYDQQTMKICLEEIKRSKKISPRPNFIILLGDRYGWLPLPYEIPQEEFEAARDYLDEKLKGSPGSNDLIEIKALLDKWYKLDENADPAAYCLAHRDPKITDDMTEEARKTARKKEEAEWNRAEAVLHEFFLDVCEKINISHVTKLKLRLSATAQEIMEGAVSESTARRHVFAFLRNIEGLPADNSSRGYADLDKNGNLDIVSRNLLNNMKERLRKQIPNNIFEYETKWTGKKDLNNEEEFPITTGHIKKFGEDVKTALTNAILDRIASDEEIGPLEREIMSHDKFGKERSKVFIGRVELLKKIDEYVKSNKTQDHSPLLLWGISGCGKTALLAKAIDEFSKENGQVVISRFIGATAESADIRLMLKSVCEEIKLKFGIAFEKEITSDMRYLPDIFKELLSMVPSDKSMTLFIDALDQLLEYENAHNVPTWLPAQIPANIKIVLSTLKGYGCYESLENSMPSENIVEITGMSKEEGEEFLKTWLSAKRRRLKGKGQREKVIAAYKKCPYPLYFKLLLEEAALWRSFNGDARTKIGDGYESMIDVLFERLSRSHGKELVSRSLGYLAAAKNGLTDDEMIDVLTHDDEFYDHFNNISFWKLKKGDNVKERERIPVVIWSKLYFDLAPYLIEKAADGTSLLNFYHRQLGEISKKRFITKENKLTRHNVLAKYFLDRSLYIEKVPNYRKCSELPFQLRKAEKFDEITNVLTDLNFIDTKCVAGMTYDLLEDYQEVINALPEAQERVEEEKNHQAKIKKYVDDLIKYSSDPDNNLLPHIDSVKIMKDEEIDAKIERLKNSENLTRLERIEEFSRFINGSAHELVKYAVNNPKFCIQQAYNSSEGGMVADAAGALISEIKNKQLLLYKKGARPAYNPFPALLKTFEGYKFRVTAVVITPDGKTAVSGSWDKTLCVWDITSRKCLKILKGHTNSVIAVAITPDGKTAVSGSGEFKGNDNTVRIWDITSGKCLKILKGHTNSVMAVAITPDSKIVVSGSEDRTLRVWDISSGKCLKTLEGHTNSVAAVAITPDGKAAVSGSWDNTLCVWDITSGKRLRTLEGYKFQVAAVAITPDGKTAVSGSWDKTLSVWDITSGKCLKILKGHTNWVTAVVITPDGKTVVSGSEDRTLRVWDISSGKCLKTLEGHTDSVAAVAITPDGNTVVSGSLDNTLRVWEITSSKCLETLDRSLVTSVAITPDGLTVVYGSLDRTLRVWDISSGKCLKILKGHTNSVIAVAITPDGKTAVSGSGEFKGNDNTVRIWDITSGKCLKILKGHTNSVMRVAFTPDGKTVVSGSEDRTLRVWDIVSGKCLRTLESRTSEVNVLAITPDGKTAVSESWNKLLVWDISTGNCLRTFEGHTSTVNSVAITPDGKTAVSGSKDRTLRVWDIVSGKCLRTLESRTNEVNVLAITPDGKTAVSGSDDYTLRVWDILSGKCLKTLEGHTDLVTAAAITPDGLTAVSGSCDSTFRLWNIASGKCYTGVSLLFEVFGVVIAGNSFVVRDKYKVNFFNFINLSAPRILTAWHNIDDNTRAFGCTHCRKWSEISPAVLDTEIPCPKCGRQIKLNPFVIEGDWREIEKAWGGE